MSLDVRRVSSPLFRLGLLAAATTVGVLAELPGVAEAAPPGVTHYPDLRPNPAYDLRVIYDDTGNKLLAFSAAAVNRGQGPLELFPVNDPTDGTTKAYQRLFTHDASGNWTEVSTQLVGTFEFHEHHNHWHLEDFASYQIRDVAPDGSAGSSVLASSEKVSFCMLDSWQVDAGLEHSAPQHYTDCGQTTVTGISVGWADVYPWSLPGQNIDVTGLPDGTYWLRIGTDPGNKLNEGGEAAKADNVSVTKFRLVGDAILPPEPDLGWERIEQTDPAVQYSGAWYAHESSNHSAGGAVLAIDGGSRAGLTFTGTGVRWVGYRDEWSGIAKVYLDGLPVATVDTYAASAEHQAVLFSTEGLVQDVHTLVIEVTGTQSDPSSAAWVWVDAFEVRTGGPSQGGGGGRIEESNASAVSYGGTWYTNGPAGHSGGTAVLSAEPGSTANLTFTGTGVRWIGYSDEWSGIAEVRLDGALVSTVDTYSSSALYQKVHFSAQGLGPGTHTLQIFVTGSAGPASGGDWIWVDAFDVTP